MRRISASCLGVLLGCGPQVTDAGSSGDASGGGGAEAGSGAASTGARGTSADATTTAPSVDSEDTLLDVGAVEEEPPPIPAHCETDSPPGTVVVERLTMPDGAEGNIEYAELAFDACSGDPSVILYTDLTAWKWRFFRLSDDIPRSWDGYVDAEFSEFEGAERAGIEFLETFEDDDPLQANADVWLTARVTIEGGGWDVSVVVDVPDCGAYDCYCPCE